ncbi:MAG TPA: hypothetical protein PLJ21_05380 [Pseudobdellovibrionaceae bacterium]|nr:hypothetical protein [Pseudobdellovibrionaceae bacterium]
MQNLHLENPVQNEAFSFYRKLLVYFSNVLEVSLPCDLSNLSFYLDDKNKLKFSNTLHEVPKGVSLEESKKIVQVLHSKGVAGIEVKDSESKSTFNIQLNWTQLNQVNNILDYLELFDVDQEIHRTSDQTELQCLNCDSHYPKETTICLSCGFSLLNPGSSEAQCEVFIVSELSQEHQIQFIKKYIDLEVDIRRPIKAGQIIIAGVSKTLAQVMIQKSKSYDVEMECRDLSSFSDFRSPLLKMSKLKEMALKNFEKSPWYKKSVPFFRIEAPLVMRRIKGDFFRSIWYRQEKNIEVQLILVDTFFHEYMRWVQIYNDFEIEEKNELKRFNSISFNHFVSHFTEIFRLFMNLRNLLLMNSSIDESILYEELKKVYEIIESFDASQKIVENYRRISG